MPTLAHAAVPLLHPQRVPPAHVPRSLPRCPPPLASAEAAYRSGNQSDLLMALIKVAGTLHAFPLPPGSAEAELVAAGVVKQTGLEFRKSLFFEFGAVSPQLAALVAEMLGFDPALVMPQLEAATAAEQQQQAAAAAEQ